MDKWKKVLIVIVCVALAITAVVAIVNKVRMNEINKQKAIEAFVEAGRDK